MFHSPQDARNHRRIILRCIKCNLNIIAFHVHSPQDARNHRRIIRTVRRVVCAHYGHLALIATCPHTLQVVHTHFSLSYLSLSLSAFMSLLSLQLARTHCKSFTHISLSLSAFMSLSQTQTHTISLSSFTQLFDLNYLFFFYQLP